MSETQVFYSHRKQMFLLTENSKHVEMGDKGALATLHLWRGAKLPPGTQSYHIFQIKAYCSELGVRGEPHPPNKYIYYWGEL